MPPGEMMEVEELKRVVEALLFATDAPLTVDRIRAAIKDSDPAEIRAVLEGLRSEYERDGHAFGLRQVAGGYQLASRSDFAPWIARLHGGRPRPRLTRAALETLAIIAYRQPVTRAEAEAIRGVNVDGVLRTLMEKKLVTVTGRREGPGRPLLFGTTRDFLAYFGLKDLKDLPEEGELQALLGEAEAKIAAEAAGEEIMSSAEEDAADEAPAEPLEIQEEDGTPVEQIPGPGGGDLPTGS